MSLSNVDDDKISEAIQSASTSIKNFSTEFYKILSRNSQNQNIVCSPISVTAVLTMAAYGAAGDTRKEMFSCLHLSNDETVNTEGFQQIINCFNNAVDVELSLSTKIFIHADCKLKPEFEETADTFFGSPPEQVELRKPDVACRVINDWAATNTSNHVKNIIQPRDIENTKMLLINAVYFKGSWKGPFWPEWTQSQPFYIDRNTTKDVLMMRRTDNYTYGSINALKAEFVELPYESPMGHNEVSMFLIYPKEVDGLRMIEDNLDKINYEKLATICKPMIILYLPKFEITCQHKLVPILQTMGMTKMFDDSADFSGITDDGPLKISNVIQQAFFEVNEKGSEATLFSRLTGGGCGPSQEIPVVRIDRPFFYALFDRTTSTVLLQGHIILPKFEKK